MDENLKDSASRAAKALAALGSAKGGKVRANTLTPEERSEIARNAVIARWRKEGKLKPKKENASESIFVQKENNGTSRSSEDNIPFSMFAGKLHLGNLELECHVLNDLRRVITQREIVRVLSSGRESGALDRYIDNIPLDTSDLRAGPTVQFRITGTSNIGVGREATFLIELCDRYLEAEPNLRRNQKHLAKIAGMIIRACAKVGIIALIDEATGYQKYRQENALRMKLQAFIAEELQEWARMFPQEFWFELARLEGINYSPRSRPLRWGKYIMAFVYDAIDKDVGNRLREINPNPQHGKNHHQWMKEFGKEKLIGQIQSVITIMKLCNNMTEFRNKFAKVFSKSPLQTTFDDINWALSEN